MGGHEELKLSDLLNELSSVVNKYDSIGVQLQISTETLKKIEKEHTETNRRFIEVLSHWRKNSDTVTWDTVIAALESPFVDEKKLAKTLREKYIKSTTTSQEDAGTLTTDSASKEETGETQYIICQPSPGQLVHSDSGYMSQPLPESQRSITTAAGYAMSQPLPESQQSTATAADDREDAETIDYKSPASTPPPQPSVDPHFPLVDGHVNPDTPMEVFDTLKMFGYTKFRPHQKEAIMNVLSGISTLVILPIGLGKSLIYQLPAYLYSQSRAPCITLVVSPLISLMEDQISNFPPDLKGACLHHKQKTLQQNEILRDVVEGRINVLLLSPEALVGGSLWGGRGSPYSLSRLPPVAFACIDEVHCVSEWSHNFRPSYFCIYKILREHLDVHCVLGLTATATHTTALSVADHLGINHDNIIKRGTIIPDHLNISVSCEDNKDKALIELLQSSKYKDCGSIIVYCTRRQTTKHVAEQLNEYLPRSQSGKSEIEHQKSYTLTTSSRKRKKYASSSTSSKRCKTEPTKIAGIYHADAPDCNETQKRFMNGTLRIVVATVAFGMGLNKPDIRAVIHYDMPGSFESFVQEIGRAGRDGLPAYCHVFIDKKKKDVHDLRTYAYRNTIDQTTMKILLDEAIPECQCSGHQDTHEQSSDSPISSLTLSSPAKCKGHEIAIPIDKTTQRLDMNEECISTLLCYLELRSLLKLMGTVNDSCVLTWDGGSTELQSMAESIPAIETAIKFNSDSILDDTTEIMKFSMVKVADTLGVELLSVHSQLCRLLNDDQSAYGATSVKFSDPAIHIQTHRNFTIEDRDSICKYLCEKMKKQEERQIEKLHLIHAALRSESLKGSPIGKSFGAHAAISPDLKTMTEQYFSNEGLERSYLEKYKIPVLPLIEEVTPEQKTRVTNSVRSFMRAHSKEKFTGRSIARIFHGIQSPRYPAISWGYKNKYWRLHIAVDFNTVYEIATKICEK